MSLASKWLAPVDAMSLASWISILLAAWIVVIAIERRAGRRS